MAPKLKDPQSFSNPCIISKHVIDKDVYDLGVNVSLMPLSICEQKSTKMSLQLPDWSIKYSLGILEEVPLRIG